MVIFLPLVTNLPWSWSCFETYFQSTSSFGYRLVILVVLRSVTDRTIFVSSPFYSLLAVAAVTLGSRTCFQNLRGEITMPNSDLPVYSLFFKHIFHYMFQWIARSPSYNRSRSQLACGTNVRAVPAGLRWLLGAGWDSSLSEDEEPEF